MLTANRKEENNINMPPIAQNAYCSRDIYLQFTKYPRPVILPSIIQMNAGRFKASMLKS